MRSVIRCGHGTLVGLILLSVTGCSTLVPSRQLHMSQRHARNLYQQTQTLTVERDHANQALLAASTERDHAVNRLASMETDLSAANERVDNLLTERGELQQKFVRMLRDSTGSPLSGSATERFEELARKYPDLNFDPTTGVSKFQSDLLFASGSAELNSTALPLLRELADIMNAGEQQRLKLLIVGHTDDKRIIQTATRTKHATNWHLSTNRAASVVLALKKAGIQEQRMGAMGYSRFQPVADNVDDQARQQNRRVEIYVLAPEAAIASWDPVQYR